MRVHQIIGSRAEGNCPTLWISLRRVQGAIVTWHLHPQQVTRSHSVIVMYSYGQSENNPADSSDCLNAHVNLIWFTFPLLLTIYNLQATFPAAPMRWVRAWCVHCLTKEDSFFAPWYFVRRKSWVCVRSILVFFRGKRERPQKRTPLIQDRIVWISLRQ